MTRGWVFLDTRIWPLHPWCMTQAPAIVKEIDILELIRSGTHFAEKRGTYVYCIEARTGRTLSIHHHESGLPVQFQEETLPDGTLVVRQLDMPTVVSAQREVLYNPLTLDLICQRITEGDSLTKVLKDSAFPTYATFCRWRRAHPEIEEMLNLARRDRAEALRDQVMEYADEADEDNVNVKKFQADTAKWAAGVDDPKYSPKSKTELSVQVPTQIIVKTGIERD